MCSEGGCQQDHIHLVEGVDVSSLSVPLDSGLNDTNNYSLN